MNQVKKSSWIVLACVAAAGLGAAAIASGGDSGSSSPAPGTLTGPAPVETSNSNAKEPVVAVKAPTGLVPIAAFDGTDVLDENGKRILINLDDPASMNVDVYAIQVADAKRRGLAIPPNR